MDDQTKPANDLYNNDSAQPSDRPLTSFLQARQAVKTVEEAGKDAAAVIDESAAEDGAESAASEASLDLDDKEVETTEETRDEGADEVVSVAAAEEVLSGDSAMENQPQGDTVSPAAEASNPEIDRNKLNTALKALKQVEQQVATVIKLLETGDSTAATSALQGMEMDSSAPVGIGLKSEDLATLKPIDGRVVEGVFDGRGMVGGDGKSYMVPPNYASKSKLVEGDMLKLTITPKGSFIYKQIGPIERSRLIGSLGFDQTIGEYYATSENRRWNVIKASVTYFKGEPGDEVVLLVPKNAPSKWAAVENIIKRNPLG